MRSLRSVAIISVALFGIAACSSSGATSHANAGGPTVAASNPTPSTTVPGRPLHWTNAGPPLTLLAPFCDGGHCLYPFTETGQFHGDLEGTHVTAGATALDATGKRYAVSRTTVFTGSVKGCGSGTMVFLEDETATATSGAGHGKIAPGFGTGALRTARGEAVGVGVAGSGGIHSKLSGHITC